MEIVSVPLNKPVEHDGVTYSALSFREPEVGDLLLADDAKPGMAQLVTLLAIISDVPLPVFKKIKGNDFKAILAKTKPILGNDLNSMTGG